MKPDGPRAHPFFMRIALAVVTVLAVLGVVMAESHVPVAIEPDADRGKNVGVATFALG